MSRLSLFNSPFLLGFDQIERALDTVQKAAGDGYPPYNIEQTGDHALRITLAVAGFRDDDLSVTIEDNQLVVRGKQVDDSQGRIFLHRGIAARQFQRRFVLAEGIEVLGAHSENGLLHVELHRPEPEIRTRKIEIRSTPQAASSVVTSPGSGRIVTSGTEAAPKRRNVAARANETD